MFGIVNFGAFLIAGILLNLTPGADTMYILGRSISQGKRAGIMSALGISAGCLVHCIFASLGLSAILASSAMAFNLIKYAGAAYLIYLGIKTLVSKANTSFDLSSSTVPQSAGSIFSSGVLTNVLNPKVALFFLAFLPQFIAPDHANSPVPFMMLGLTFILTGTIWCLMLALFSARLSHKIRKNYRFKVWLDKITGCIFIAIGLKLALTKD